MSTQDSQDILQQQIRRLQELHFQLLYWATMSEGKGIKYNITNAFDDLKAAGLTRTKQTAVAAITALETLCFIDLKDEHNRKNIYITKFGGQALQSMVIGHLFTQKKSAFLENTK